MFFSQDILTRKGGSLGLVWIAANFEPGLHRICLTRREYCSVNISKACEEILFPRHPMALRLSSCLMVGILRVYRQQTHYVYVESKTVWQRIKSAYEKTVPQTDLPGGHPRSEAVTLPDPTLQVSPNTTFPGEDYSCSLDFLVDPVADFFSLSALMPRTTDSPQLTPVSGSPYTANPKDISIEEDDEMPLEAMQIQVPDDQDFGGGELRGAVEGAVVMMDDVLMPTLNMSDDMECGGGAGDYSSDGDGGCVDEEEEKEMDSVLLFDENTNSFQLYNEKEEHQAQQKVETPLLPLQPNADNPDDVRPASPLMETHAKRVRRKLAFDVNIKTKSAAIKHNMATAETTLRSKRALCHPLPCRVKPASLLAQPTCRTTLQSPNLLTAWHKYQTQPQFADEKEFELDELPTATSSDVAAGSRPESASILSDREVAREHSSLGASSLEVLRAVDEGERLMDSHHTTTMGASISDLSSSTSTHQHSSLGFETSSAQRQTGPSKLPPLSMGGLSPIPDVDRETETSFGTQPGDLEFPDLDVSYGSTGTPRAPHLGGVASTSPSIASSPRAYFRQVLSAMGNRPEVEFQELLPKDSTCRTACRAFSHVLELINNRILTPTQAHPYDSIKLSRGVLF